MPHERLPRSSRSRRVGRRPRLPVTGRSAPPDHAQQAPAAPERSRHYRRSSPRRGSATRCGPLRHGRRGVGRWFCSAIRHRTSPGARRTCGGVQGGFATAIRRELVSTRWPRRRRRRPGLLVLGRDPGAGERHLRRPLAGRDRRRRRRPAGCSCRDDRGHRATAATSGPAGADPDQGGRWLSVTRSASSPLAQCVADHRTVAAVEIAELVADAYGLPPANARSCATGRRRPGRDGPRSPASAAYARRPLSASTPSWTCASVPNERQALLRPARPPYAERCRSVARAGSPLAVVVRCAFARPAQERGSADRSPLRSRSPPYDG